MALKAELRIFTLCKTPGQLVALFRRSIIYVKYFREIEDNSSKDKKSLSHEVPC